MKQADTGHACDVPFDPGNLPTQVTPTMLAVFSVPLASKVVQGRCEQIR
jgi:hypothetical protein